MASELMMTSRPSLPMTGGCSCGVIRYEITIFPLLLYACNCTNCQTASGSAFALNMPVATKGFRIVEGEPKGWRHASPTGVAVISWFCSDCGARIFGERSGRPDSMNVRAGTLDDTTWLTPVAHFYVKCRQDRSGAAAGAECFETEPSDFKPLIRRWRTMWPEFFPVTG
jgi:hypothetical protein